jgi:hypothetical protein
MKKAITGIGALLTAGVLFTLTASADVNISIPTTSAQDAKLARVMARLNAERETPYTDIEEMLEDQLTRHMQKLVRELDERELGDLKSAWEGADETTKEQIRTLLGVQ